MRAQVNMPLPRDSIFPEKPSIPGIRDLTVILRRPDCHCTNVKRERQNYTVSGDYLLSEKTMTTFSYDYLNDKYDSVSYTDLESHTFNLGFIRDMSNVLESTKARMNMGYAKYNMPDMKIDNYEATIGIDRALNEKWNLVINGGARYTDSRFNTIEICIRPAVFY